jgi:hypothetical protein
VSYFTLISSLPHLPPHFDVDRVPITRPRLDRRLRLLRGHHVEMIEQFASFLAWDRQPLERTDEEMVKGYEDLHRQVMHPLVMQLVEHRINVRTIVSAVRRRFRRQGPPIGVGNLVVPIRQNWQQPQFGLEYRFPWIEQFEKLMIEGDAVEAERILYEVTWSRWSRMADDYHFSFEAVLLYLARWSIIDRWTSRSLEKGSSRFDQLIEETLGEYARLEF